MLSELTYVPQYKTPFRNVVIFHEETFISFHSSASEKKGSKPPDTRSPFENIFISIDNNDIHIQSKRYKSQHLRKITCP